jgi:hypothetical protein
MKRPEVHAKRSLCLDRGDDDLKMPQMRGPCAKCQDEPRGEERARTGPEKAQAGRPVRTGPSTFVAVRVPLCSVLSRCNPNRMC